MTVRFPILPQPQPPRGNVHIRVERCKGCQLCIECCPTNVLTLSVGFNAKGYHYPEVASDACINCQACATICPDYAIFSTPLHSEAGAARPLELALGGT